MKKELLFIVIFPIFLSSCFAPINLTFESAKTLNQGEFDLQGNYSRYYEPGYEDDDLLNVNNNFGVKLGYGINDKYTIKFRYERLVMNPNYFIDLFDISEVIATNFIEIENKFQFKNANIAMGVPLGYYGLRTEDKISQGIFSLDPRVYFTFFGVSNKFELNLIPKAHFLITDGGMAILPGISLGLGFSSDLNKWVVRPELAFDGYFSFGIGLNLNMSNLLNSNK